MSRKRKREGEKGEDATVAVKRRCGQPFVPLKEDSECCGNYRGDLLGASCGLSDCGSEASSGVLVVTDVLVSPSSTVVVMNEPLVLDSDWEVVESQSFSFSRKHKL